MHPTDLINPYPSLATQNDKMIRLIASSLSPQQYEYHSKAYFLFLPHFVLLCSIIISTFAFQPVLQLQLSQFKLTTTSISTKENKDEKTHINIYSSILYMKKNKYASSSSSSSSSITLSPTELNQIEKQAIEASDLWSISLTPFYNKDDADIIKSHLDKRGDVKYIPIGNIPIQSSNYNESLSRCRFVLTNPDLELDIKDLEKEYCAMISIDQIQSSTIGARSTTRMSASEEEVSISSSSNKSKPWPSLFIKIGIELKNVGEVVIEEENNCAYVIVDPSVVKQCMRLLPKELRGVGISVSEMEVGEYIPYDSIQQDMELGVLDKRYLQYDS